jgi:hypothetical protein
MEEALDVFCLWAWVRTRLSPKQTGVVKDRYADRGSAGSNEKSLIQCGFPCIPVTQGGGVAIGPSVSHLGWKVVEATTQCW